MALRNIKPIIESFHKNKYDKNVVYICSKYTDQEIEKNQKLGLENKVVDINLNPLSNSTFISTINLKKLQDNKHNNNKVIKINYNIKKRFS